MRRLPHSPHKIKEAIFITELKRKENMDFSMIKATASPYAIRPNEKVEIAKPERLFGYIDKLTITEKERLILGCVNYLMFATSMQISWMLASHGIEQKEIHKTLSKMYHAGYLHKMEFRENGAISSFKVYAITGDRGYMLFKQIFGTRPNTKRDFFNKEDLPIRIKQILSANQLMAQLVGIAKCDIPSHSQVFSIKRLFKKPMLIRTIGYFEINQTSYWVESVRKCDDYITNFEDRLKRLEYFQKNYRRIDKVNDTALASKPHIIVIAEDEKHMKELICSVKEYDFTDVTFTHDMALIGNWENAFKPLTTL